MRPPCKYNRSKPSKSIIRAASVRRIWLLLLLMFVYLVLLLLLFFPRPLCLLFKKKYLFVFGKGIVWRSEDNLHEPFPSFYYLGSRDWTRCQVWPLVPLPTNPSHQAVFILYRDLSHPPSSSSCSEDPLISIVWLRSVSQQPCINL